MELIIRKGPQAHPGGGRDLCGRTALRRLHGLYGRELPGGPKAGVQRLYHAAGLEYQIQEKRQKCVHPLSIGRVFYLHDPHRRRRHGGDGSAAGGFHPLYSGKIPRHQNFPGEPLAVPGDTGSGGGAGPGGAGIPQAALHGPDARSDPGKRKENDTGKRKGNDTGKRKGNGRARERKTERG